MGRVTEYWGGIMGAAVHVRKYRTMLGRLQCISMQDIVLLWRFVKIYYNMLYCAY